MTHVNRRRLLQLGAGLAGGLVLGERSAALIAGAAGIGEEAVPAAPSPQAVHVYQLLKKYRPTEPVPSSAQDFVRRREADQRALQGIRVPRGASVTGVHAGGVPAQLFRAPGASRDRVILYLHGGGFYGGLSNLDRVLAVQLSLMSGMAVLLPDYRLMPEHPFPAALDDCVAAYRWLLRQGLAPGRCAIAGDSAGANLTLATALVLRHQGEPLPAALVAQSPPTDLALTGASYRTKANVDLFISRAFVQAIAAAYTANGATSVRDPLVSPLYANLRGLPPTLIQVGTLEVLLDDATRLAARMGAAGDAVTVEVWPGMWHGWPLTGITLPFPEAALAVRHIAHFVQRHVRA